MKPLRRELESEEGTKEANLGRRNFLRRAGMAAAVVGGLEAVGMTFSDGRDQQKVLCGQGDRVVPTRGPESQVRNQATRDPALQSAGQCTFTWTCTPRSVRRSVPASRVVLPLDGLLRW